MKTKYCGNILAVREIEDTVRATKKYTKGAFARSIKHPIQGEDFPSKVLTEYYEVYPDTEISWDMPAGVALDWLWGDVLHIDILFQYDYRSNKAAVIIYGNDGVVKELANGVPGFQEALEKVTPNNQERTANNVYRQ